MADNTIAYKVINNGVEDIYDIPVGSENEFLNDMRSSGLNPERVEQKADAVVASDETGKKQTVNASDVPNFVSKESANRNYEAKKFSEWQSDVIPENKKESTISASTERINEKRPDYVNAKPAVEEPVKEDETTATADDVYISSDKASKLANWKSDISLPTTPEEYTKQRRDYYKSQLERNGVMYTESDIDKIDKDFVDNAEYEYFMRESAKIGNKSGLSDAEMKLYRSGTAKRDASMESEITDEEREAIDKVENRNMAFWNSPLAKRVMDRQIADRKKGISDLNADMKAFESEHKIAVDDGEGGVYYKWDSPESIKDYNMMSQARKLKLDALDTWKAPSKYGDTSNVADFIKGTGNRVSDADFWTFNLTKLSRDLNVRDIFEKIEDYEKKHGGLNNGGEYNLEDILTTGEQELLNAFYTNAQAESARAGNLSRSYTAGQTFTDAIPFMVEFFLTDGAASAVKTGVAKALEKYIGKRAFGKFVSRSVGGLASSIAKTAMMPSAYTGVGDKLTELDENGKLKFSRLQASGIQAVDAGIETLSESFGTALDQIGITPARLAKALEGKRFGRTMEVLSEFGDKLFGDNSILKRGGFNGTIGESIEEVYGTALRSLYSEIAGDDAFGSSSEQWRQFFGRDNMVSMLESFGVMGLLGGAFTVDDRAVNNRIIKNKARSIEKIFTGMEVSQKKVRAFLDNFDNMTLAEQDEAYTDLLRDANHNQNITAATYFEEIKKAQEALTDLRRASIGNQMIDMAEERRNKDRMEDSIFLNPVSNNVIDDDTNSKRSAINTARISLLNNPPIVTQAVIQKCFESDGWETTIGGKKFSIEHITGNTYSLKGDVGNIGANGEYLFRIGENKNAFVANEGNGREVPGSNNNTAESSGADNSSESGQPEVVAPSVDLPEGMPVPTGNEVVPVDNDAVAAPQEAQPEEQVQQPQAISDEDVVSWFRNEYGISISRKIGGRDTGSVFPVTIDGEEVGYLTGNTGKVATVAQYLKAGEYGVDGKKHNKDGWYESRVNLSDISTKSAIPESAIARQFYDTVMAAEKQAETDEANAGNELVNNEVQNTVSAVNEAQADVSANITADEAAEVNGSAEKQDEMSDEDFEKSLPRDKKGELAYDSFTPAQTFRYTAMISGMQDAVDDAAQTVATRMSQLDTLNESLKSAVGTDKLKIRAQIAKTMKEVEEYAGLISDAKDNAGIVPSQNFDNSGKVDNFNENNTNDSTGSDKRGNRKGEGKKSVRSSVKSGEVVREVADEGADNGEVGGGNNDGGEVPSVSREVSEDEKSESGGNSDKVAEGNVGSINEVEPLPAKVQKESILDSEKKANKNIDGLMSANGIPGASFAIVKVTPAEFKLRMEFIVDGSKNPNSWMVDVYDSYDGINCYLSEDGLSGVAVKPDGDIVSLFSGVAGQHRSNRLILFAISKGGRKLDFYTTSDKFGLQDLYSKFGATITGWTPFNPIYVPEEHRGDKNHDVAAAYFPSTVEEAARMFDDNARADYMSTTKFEDIEDENGNVTDENTGYGRLLDDRDKKISDIDEAEKSKTTLDKFKSGLDEVINGDEANTKNAIADIRRFVKSIKSKSEIKELLAYVTNTISDIRQVYGSDVKGFDRDTTVKFLRQIQRSMSKLHKALGSAEKIASVDAESEDARIANGADTTAPEGETNPSSQNVETTDDGVDSKEKSSSGKKSSGTMASLAKKREGKAHKSRPYANSAQGIMDLVDDMDADGMTGKARNDAISAKLGRGLKSPAKVIAIRSELRNMLNDSNLSSEEKDRVTKALYVVSGYIYDMQTSSHVDRRAPYMGVMLDNIDGISHRKQAKNSDAKAMKIAEMNKMLNEGINTEDDYIELAKKRAIFDRLFFGNGLNESNQDDYNDFSKRYNEAKKAFEDKVGKGYSEIVGGKVSLAIANEIANNPDARLSTILEILDSNKYVTEEEKSKVLSKYSPEEVEDMRKQLATKSKGGRKKSEEGAMKKITTKKTAEQKEEEKKEREEAKKAKPGRKKAAAKPKKAAKSSEDGVSFDDYERDFSSVVANALAEQEKLSQKKREEAKQSTNAPTSVADGERDSKNSELEAALSEKIAEISRLQAEYDELSAQQAELANRWSDARGRLSALADAPLKESIPIRDEITKIESDKKDIDEKVDEKFGELNNAKNEAAKTRQSIRKAITSDGKPATKEEIARLVDRLSMAMPKWVGVNVLSGDEFTKKLVEQEGTDFFNSSGEVCGFVGTDGNVYINADNCKFSTPIHEIGIHKLLDIARENGYDNLKTAIIKYGKNAPEEFKAAVRSAYPNLAEGSEDFYEEVAAHAFGAAFEDRQAEFAKQNAFQRLLQAFKDFMSRLFGGKYARLNAFDGVKSMGEKEIGDALYKLVMGGKQIAALQKKLDGQDSVFNRGVRAQIIGLVGAQKMGDAGLQAGIDAMDNWFMAVRMRNEDKDAKYIRLSTGWELGPDGEWKYEIPDITIKNDAYDEGVSHIIDDGWSDASAPLKELANDNEYLKELLAAYPELGKINVALYYNPYDARKGSYRKKDGVILLNLFDKHAAKEAKYNAKLDGTEVDPDETFVRDKYGLELTLVHEIQHAIQIYEGWTGGVSHNSVKGYVENRYGYNEKEIRDRIDRLNDEYSDAFSRGDKDAIGRLSVEISDAQLELRTFYNLVHSAYEEVYGEAESRLVSLRHGYDTEERKDVTLSEDYDVDTEDMIFSSGDELIRKYGAGSMSKANTAVVAGEMGMSEEEFTGECKDASETYGTYIGLIDNAPFDSATAGDWLEYFAASGMRKRHGKGGRVAKGEGRLVQYLQRMDQSTVLSADELLSELSDEYETNNPSSWKNLSYLSGLKTTLYEAWTYLKDDILAYGLIRGSIISAGGALGVDFEEMHNTQSSRAQTQIDDFNRQIRTPLLGAVSELVKAGKDMEEISDYLVALHASERNRKMVANAIVERFNSEDGHDGRLSMNDALALYDHIILGGPYSQTSLSLADEVDVFDIFSEYEGDENAEKRALVGADMNGNAMTDEHAEEIINAFEQGVDRKLIDDMLSNVKMSTDWIVDKARSYGLITEDMANEYKNQYEHYIPLVDWDSEEDKEDSLDRMNDGNFDRDYNSSINVDILKKARGRKTRSFNPIAMIYQRGVSTILTGEENKSRTALYDTVLANQNLSGVFFIEGADVPDWAEDINGSTKLDNHSVDVYIDGARKRMYFAGQAGIMLHNGLNGCYSVSKRLAKWANNAKHNENISGYNIARTLRGIWNGFRSATAIRSKISTTWNVLFNIVNLERDFKYALKQNYIQHGAKQALDFAKNVLFGDAFKESISSAMGNPSADFRQYLEYGGNIGYSQALKNEDAKRSIIRDIDRMAKGKSPRGEKGVMRALERFAESFENVSRYASFKAAIDNGASVESAAYMAHQASTNLSRRGTQTLLGGTFMFFNASLEGLNQAVRNWKGFEGKDAQARQAAASVVNLALTTAWIFMLRAWTNAIDPDDDDDKKNAYAALPDYVKKDGYVIPFGVDEYGRIEGLRFRYAFQYRVPNYLMEKMIECVSGDIDESFPEFLSEAARSFVTEYYPLSGTAMSSAGDKGNFSLGKNLVPVPTALKPIFDASANINQFGGAIASGKDNNRPAWTNAKSGTDVSAREISKFLNSISGGKGEIKSGMVNISPEKLEYIFDSYLGIGAQMWGHIDNYAIGDISGKMSDAERERYGEKDPISQRFWYNGTRDMMRGRSEEWKTNSESAAKDAKNAAAIDYRELGNLTNEERRELAKSAAITGSSSYRRMSNNRDKLEKLYNQNVVRSEDTTLPKPLRDAANANALRIKDAIERINAIMGEVYEDKIKDLNIEKEKDR